MDLELKHLGQTLAVGGFAVYAVVFVVRTCRKSWLPGFFEAKTDDIGLQNVPVYLALMLGAGIVVQALARDIVSERDVFEPRQLSKVFMTDYELRLRSLFKKVKIREDQISVKAAPLLKELQKLSPRHEGVREYYCELKRYAHPIGLYHPKEPVLRQAVNGIFYDAKNRVYQEDTYYHELSDIFDLMDFTRSLTLLCLLFAPLYFALFVLGLIPRSASFLDIESSEQVTLILMAIVFFAGIFVSKVAYRLESEGYNRRVFGYYISLMRYSKEVALPASKLGPTVSSKKD